MKLPKNQAYEAIPAIDETSRAILDAAAATLADCWQKAKVQPLLVAPRDNSNDTTLAAVRANQAAMLDYLRYTYAHRSKEHAVLVLMDTYGRLITVEELNVGSARHCELSSRLIAQHCILHNAFYVVLAHNHPGGDCAPSPGDEQATRTVGEFLAGMEVTLLDHVVLAANGIASVVYHMLTRGGRDKADAKKIAPLWAGAGGEADAAASKAAAMADMAGAFAKAASKAGADGAP